MTLIYFLIAVTLINSAYFLLFSRFSFSKESDKDLSNLPPVSLIVCAKNEEENLKKHIPIWLNQNYPRFEIILINDASIDDTKEVMEYYTARDSRIKIVDVENNEAFWGSKKYAMTLGIKKAKYEHLVFIDADCFPASDSWLQLMSARFSTQKQIVLGYGAYLKEKGLLNSIIRFETLMTAVQYFSYAKAGNPYMGVGRNLAYTSPLFFHHNGFINHMKIQSGDDDLFVNEAATSANTEICTDPAAFTYSIPKNSWKSWIRQKTRHYGTAGHYRRKHRWSLGMFYLSNLLFWILVPIVLATGYWQFGLGIILFRILIQYLIIGKAAKKLKENNLIPFIPFFEFFLVLLQLFIFILYKRNKNVQWK